MNAGFAAFARWGAISINGLTSRLCIFIHWRSAHINTGLSGWAGLPLLCVIGVSAALGGMRWTDGHDQEKHQEDAGKEITQPAVHFEWPVIGDSLMRGR